MDALYWISNLKLEPHPEGGFFKEVYRAAESVSKSALPERFSGDRCFCTGIYYLLQQGDFSAFHRIQSDETWHFYAGGRLDLHILVNGEHRCIPIGSRVDAGEHLQWTVPANAWFAARPADGSSFSLTGCTVSPGFEFDDFELAEADQLARDFPRWKEVIIEFTRS